MPRAENPLSPTASVSAGRVSAPCARSAASMAGAIAWFFFACIRRGDEHAERDGDANANHGGGVHGAIVRDE